MAVMPRPDPFALVDTQPEPSVSFAPPDHPAIGSRTRDAEPRPRVAVGPGRAAIATPALVRGAPRDRVSTYPIQPGKVQRPPLRDETLARHRLLDWLDVKIHNRVVFVIADAGYGKTTLLADFSGRTRLRTLWYRMDEEDCHWVSFMSYLVAAGREHDVDFAPRTSALLADTGPGGANRDDAVSAFFKELPAIVADGAILILDDFHVADDIPDIRSIARELVARAPERLTLVFSSRRMPSVPVARLRALGEVAELRTADLRFSTEETEALFKDTYGRALEPDVLADLSRRTDGWAASLHLVRTALRDRSASETRAFIRGLSGAQSELYDYLAEEVVGDLPVVHQLFLMRTSVLQAVEPEQAEVATGLDSATVAALIAESERLGLLSRRQGASRQGHRYHPLVREFLEARLRRDVGDRVVADLHRDVARWAEAADWQAACFHYAEAGDTEDLHRILNESIESIVGTGEIALAAGYLDRFPPETTTAGFEVIRSRDAGINLSVDAAIAHAHRAVELQPDSDVSQSNLMATYFLAGDQGNAMAVAGRLARSAQSPMLRTVGSAAELLIQASLDGGLAEARAALTKAVDESRRLGLTHYEGVGLLNMAAVDRAAGMAKDAIRDAADAFDCLSRSSAGSEAVAALMAQAWAQAHLGRLDDARSSIALASERCTTAWRPEWLTEAADIEASYGDELIAASLLEELSEFDINPALTAMTTLTRVQLAIRLGQLQSAQRWLAASTSSVATLEPGFVARRRAVAALFEVQSGHPQAREHVVEALSFARRQGSGLWVAFSQTLLLTLSANLDAGLERVDPVYVGLLAEPLLDQLHRMDDRSIQLVTSCAQAWPDRMRNSIRRVMADSDSTSRLYAARILDVMGTRSDIPQLRAVARAHRTSRTDSRLGKGLARRLAEKVLVEDQGRVEIRIGSAKVPGAELRRKVLAMLCFLLTRPRFSATRDEVIDALWPDMAPDIAVNSLNQTVYFLRRVFEPGYKEDTSAAYVNHDSDVLWLDRDLIQSRSQLCRALLDDLGSPPSPDDVDRLSDMYHGKFALDFAYEEWAVPFRDALHVGYLQVVEQAVRRDMDSGHNDRAIRLARRALDIDPETEGLELSLLRLYRVTGAHAAAAEQYEHYASMLREEHGIEPPPLSSL